MTQIKIKMINSNVLVKFKDRSTSFVNGITVQEERGKKDIVCGEVIAADNSLTITQKDIIFFPLYAAVPIILNVDGQEVLYHIINYSDIYMIQKD